MLIGSDSDDVVYVSCNSHSSSDSDVNIYAWIVYGRMFGNLTRVTL